MTAASVAAPEHVPALPLAYLLWRYSVSPRIEFAQKSLFSRLGDMAEAAVLTLAPLIVSALASKLMGGGAAYPFVMAALWGLIAIGMEGHLASTRSTVVGGWQASHDQRYRVGSDGHIRDVRGHRYGQDRYQEFAPGALGAGERLTIRASAAWVGLFFAAAGGLFSPLAYQAALTGVFAAADMLNKPRAPRGP